MSDDPAYPPPPPYPGQPDQPPEGYQAPAAPVAPPPAPSPAPVVAPPPTAYPPTAYPPPSYPPAAYYGSPSYGYPPPAQPRSSGNLRTLIAVVIVLAVLLVGVLGYVLAGYALATSRISDATNAINAMSAHRSFVNTEFDLLGQQVSSFEAPPNDAAAKSTAGQLASETQGLTALLGADDRTLAGARSHLNDQQWLTWISSGRVGPEATRIDHARQAVTSVKSAAGDYVLLGQFFQAYFQALIDAGTLLAADKSGDIVGEATADAALQADVVKAQQESTNAPWLPSQYHDFLLALQAFGIDVAKALNARTAAAFDAAIKLVQADLMATAAIDFTGSGARIKAYYQHYRDDFNTEMDRAIA